MCSKDTYRVHLWDVFDLIVFDPRGEGFDVVSGFGFLVALQPASEPHRVPSGRHFRYRHGQGLLLWLIFRISYPKCRPYGTQSFVYQSLCWTREVSNPMALAERGYLELSLGENR